MDTKYVIIENEYVESINFDEIIETSSLTLRFNLDHTMAIVKYIGKTPIFLENYTIYSHKQIIEIINNPDNNWIEN
tara:strand:- start:1466 stop:1693 length:228 start_codon:yes stop_codon:yes gene_type:complete